MLTTIFLDPSCLTLDNYLDEAASRSAVQVFVDWWEKCGIVVIPGNSNYQDELRSSLSLTVR
jgi:hypothetical protein